MLSTPTAASLTASRQARTLVAVLAHADDESAAGPALARFAREGVNVQLIVVTNGGMGFGGKDPAGDVDAASRALIATRTEEAQCAARALGAAPPILLGFPDAKLGDYLSDRGLLAKVTARLAEELARLRPNAIVTWGPDGGSGHPDHRLVSALVTQLVRAGAPGTTDRLFYMHFPADAARSINPQRTPPPFLTPDEKYVTTVVTFTPADANAAQRAVACHRSQFAPDVVERMTTVMAQAWNGRLQLAPMRPGVTSVF